MSDDKTNPEVWDQETWEKECKARFNNGSDEIVKALGPDEIVIYFYDNVEALRAQMRADGYCERYIELNTKAAEDFNVGYFPKEDNHKV